MFVLWMVDSGEAPGGMLKRQRRRRRTVLSQETGLGAFFFGAKEEPCDRDED